MIKLSIEELFENHANSLGLTWLAGQKSNQRALVLEQDQKLANVSYLNLIHPPQIQIIGTHELAYLNSLSTDFYKNTITQLFKNSSLACIIVVDNPSISPALRKAAEHYKVPILTSTLSGEFVINYLYTTITKLLSQPVTLHGVFMDVLGMGVLIMGDSGTGKSELALELVSRGHRLIADDAPEFSKISPQTIVGTCPSDMNAFLEVRGLGILNVQALFGDSATKKDKYLRLIVQLRHVTSIDLKNIDRLQGDNRVRHILGTEIPEVSLPVAPGRNLAVLLECAVRNYSLKSQDYNAADDFCEKQRQLMLNNQV
ncbi:HPr(Ser) kinase/phosphatase [Candidatus Halobeggiatoa sp. HSG11]|nr:HPr(Ser) kinase/phosphatase [Candidatus Halobeggiatoa sp. HSG11]